MSIEEAKRMLLKALTVSDAVLIEDLELDFWNWLDWASVQVVLCQQAKEEG